MPDDCHGRVFLPVATGDCRMNMTLLSNEYQPTVIIETVFPLITVDFISERVHKKVSPEKCCHSFPKILIDYYLFCRFKLILTDLYSAFCWFISNLNVVAGNPGKEIWLSPSPKSTSVADKSNFMFPLSTAYPAPSTASTFTSTTIV